MFLLLLDCVWQLWSQFPLALGFSEALLLRLATEVYASNYGTFLCNSDQERSVMCNLTVTTTTRLYPVITNKLGTNGKENNQGRALACQRRTMQ